MSGKLILISDMERFDSKLRGELPNLQNNSVVCITTAAVGEGNPDWMPKEINPLKEKVKNFIEFDLTGKTKLEVKQALEGVDIIYVIGGNTYYLLEHIQKTGFTEIVKDKIKAGAVYIGASAGAVVACPDIGYIENLDDPSKADLTDFTAMKLLDFLIMPHIDHESYSSQIIPIVEKIKKGNQMVIGLKEDQGLVVEGSYLKVI